MNENGQTLGEFLRHEREKRSITLEQVASASKISVRLLHALEADHYAEMPAKPFIRGFVNSYCRFIGLYSKEVLTRFESFIDRKSAERPSREAGLSGYAFEKREGNEQNRTLLWVVMGVFGVLGAVLFLVLKPTLKHRRSAKMEELRAAHAKASPSAGVSVTPIVSASALPSPAASGAPAPVATVKLLVPTVVPPGMLGPVLQMPVLPKVVPVPTPKPSAAPSPKPTPVALPTAKPTPKPTPQPSPKASPSAKPTPKPSPSAKPSAKPSPKPTPLAQPALPTPPPPVAPVADAADPLNSGVNLKSAQTKYKAIFRAVDDVWVRYQVDGKGMMKFPLRKGRILVLRAEREIRFQTGQADQVTINLNGAGEKPVGQARGLVKRQGNATLIFPAESAEKIGDPFPGERTLPAFPPSNKPNPPSASE